MGVKSETFEAFFLLTKEEISEAGVADDTSDKEKYSIDDDETNCSGNGEVNNTLSSGSLVSRNGSSKSVDHVGVDNAVVKVNDDDDDDDDSEISLLLLSISLSLSVIVLVELYNNSLEN